MAKKSEKKAKDLKKEYEEKQAILHYEQSLKSTSAMSTRSRAITVGPAASGVVEVILRSDTHMLWHQLQPVEAIEFIESIAAAVGVYVATKPKDDYASWRNWSVENTLNSGYDITWRGALPGNDASTGLKLDLNNSNTRSLPKAESDE